MDDTFESLMKERREMCKQLADWWQRWEVLGVDGNGLMPLDEWARETPEATAERIAPLEG